MLVSLFGDAAQIDGGTQWAQFCAKTLCANSLGFDRDGLATFSISDGKDSAQNVADVLSHIVGARAELSEDFLFLMTGDAMARNSWEKLSTTFIPSQRRYDCSFCVCDSGQYGRLGALREGMGGVLLSEDVIQSMPDEGLRAELIHYDAIYYGMGGDLPADGLLRTRLISELKKTTGPCAARTNESEFLRAHMAPRDEAGIATWGLRCPDCHFIITEESMAAECGPVGHEEEAVYARAHCGRRWRSPPLLPHIAYIVCVLHWLLASARLFWDRAVARACGTEEAARRVIAHMKELGVDVKLGAAQQDSEGQVAD